MADEAQTPPPDAQATPTEPVSEPASVEPTPDPETAQPEIAPTPEAPPTDAPAVAGKQTESAPEAPSGAGEAPKTSENLEAVIDTTPQNTSAAPEPPSSVPDSAEATTGKQDYGRAQQTAQTAPAQSTTSVIRPHGDLALANAKIQETKRRKLDKIMEKLSEKGRITNDEVEKLLRVSDATATRHLQTLEKENRIKQTGKTGMAVFYEKM